LHIHILLCLGKESTNNSSQNIKVGLMSPFSLAPSMTALLVHPKASPALDQGMRLVQKQYFQLSYY
jgi:hypothetical protein